MNNLQTFDEFINESYGGPVGVTFNNIPFGPPNRELYIHLDDKISVLDFRSEEWMSDRQLDEWKTFNKFIKANKFKTSSSVIEQYKEKYHTFILDGYYEVSDANNQNSELTQRVNNHLISFMVPNFYLKKGKIEYGEGAD